MSGEIGGKHWQKSPLRYICELSPEVNFNNVDANDEITFLPMDKIKHGFFVHHSDIFSKFSASYVSFSEGDILLAKVTPCFENGNIAIAENLIMGIGFGSSELFVIRPKKVQTKFLFYVLQSESFKGAAKASMTGAGGLKRIEPELLRRYYTHLPPTHEQIAIANYLDRETARIDALIAEKERMLALLEEKRLALVSRAVTRGLVDDVPLKPSGLEWLGDIPEHWDVERAKNLFSVRDQRSESGEEELLTVSHITGVTSRAEKDVNMFLADDKSGYKLCYKDDFAVNTLWAWMGAMGISPLEGIVSPDYHVYVTNGALLPEFVELLCRSKPFIAEVNRWSKGVWSSRLRLYPENFFEMRLPVPPHEEQMFIVKSVHEHQKIANELVKALQDSITIAKERRAALITAAVTGQIPVEEMHA